MFLRKGQGFVLILHCGGLLYIYIGLFVLDFFVFGDKSGLELKRQLINPRRSQVSQVQGGSIGFVSTPFRCVSSCTRFCCVSTVDTRFSGLNSQESQRSMVHSSHRQSIPRNASGASSSVAVSLSLLCHHFHFFLNTIKNYYCSVEKSDDQWDCTLHSRII